MQSREGAKESTKRREVPIEVLKGRCAIVSEMCVGNRGTPYHKNDPQMIQMRSESPDLRAMVHEGVKRS